MAATETSTAPGHECYYCGTHTPNPSPTNLCPQRAGEMPCIPRRLFRGPTSEVRAAMRRLGLR